MKKYWKEIIITLLLAFIMPWLFTGIMTKPAKNQDNATTATTELEQDATIYVWMEDRVSSMSLSRYLTGVLLCEIPGSFHIEAKRAQAVVARTYTLRTVMYKDKHPMQAICTDSACCQGYRDPQDYIAAGGKQRYVDEAKQAVSDTADMVLTYQGALIDATYFSCSGGQTEDALAVWGSDIPYLQSVLSPGEENASHYSDEVCFTPQQLQEALGIVIYGSPEKWISNIAYTRGGGVEIMDVGGKLFSGTTLRSALGLRSTAFTVEFKDNLFIFTTKGFGHRVGMSQYGADAMAESGKEWPQILMHYYTGVTVEKYEFS